MHIVVEGSVALVLGAHDLLIVWMVVEILAMEVHFEAAAIGDSFQASSCRCSSLLKQKIQWVALHKGTTSTEHRNNLNDYEL